MKNILTIDLGTTMGFAIKSLKFQRSGTVSFKQSRFDGGGIRFLKFEQWLNEQLADIGTIGTIDAIFYEEVRGHTRTDASHVYGGFQSILCAFCEKNNIPYEGIHTGTIKKHITGKGNAGKQAVIDAVVKLGFNPADDNEADAIAILDYVLKRKIGEEK